MTQWYENQLGGHAPKGGCEGVNGHFYSPGEFLPFYVPRAEMPQIDENDYPALLEFLSQQNIDYSYVVYRPEQLHAHQKVNMDRVHTMDKNTFQKDILISLDEYVIDGNHRWWAHKIAHKVLGTIRIHLEFEQAMEAIFKFPKTYTYGALA
jgi:hypothetical protein